jgi:site-specific DNA-methyltransferase (adenine-specific)
MTIEPYYADDVVTLWHGDCRELLPSIETGAVACVADPPYGETTAAWDRWPAGWVEAVAAHLPADTALWCYGSMRLHLDRAHEFRAAGFKFAQDLWQPWELEQHETQLWEKANGSGPGSRDRLFKVHEIANHWYRGRWGTQSHEWPREVSNGPDKGTVRKLARAAAHQRPGRQTTYVDDGTRQPRSVQHLRIPVQHLRIPSVRFAGRHQDEKPVGVMTAPVRESTPPGAAVLDPMAGAGTVGIVARLTGRRAVLIEGDEATCEKTAHRLEEAANDLLAVTP